MRAMVMDRIGGPGVLHMAQIEEPVALPGQIVMRVIYAGVNPADWKVREGSLARYFTYRFPFVLGFDAAGHVTQVGAEVNGLAVGDRVVCASNVGRGERGTYAEYVAVDAERVVRLPDHVGLAEAATLPTAGMTAWEATLAVGGAAPGQTIFINGGAGGVGGFAIQLAKMAGATVATSCSGDNLAYVRALGADIAIDYRDGNVAGATRRWAPDGVDLLVDTVGQGTLPEAVTLVRRGGMLAVIGSSIPHGDAHDDILATDRQVTVRTIVSQYASQPAQLRGLVDALATGRIVAPEIMMLPLAEVGIAHRRLAGGHGRGKILLRVAEPQC